MFLNAFFVFRARSICVILYIEYKTFLKALIKIYIQIAERSAKPSCSHRPLQGEAVRLQHVRVLHRQKGQAEETPVHSSQPGQQSHHTI